MLGMILKTEMDLKERIGQILDALADLIMKISDVLVFKHVTLSEAGLFILAAGRGLWFLAFGVENANYDYKLPEWFWIAVFTGISVLHLVGFFLKTLRIRIVSVYCYAFVWFFLMMIAAYSGTKAPAVPTLLFYTANSVFIIVRLSRESKSDGR